jgi:hypothetical protein
VDLETTFPDKDRSHEPTTFIERVWAAASVTVVRVIATVDRYMSHIAVATVR